MAIQYIPGQPSLGSLLGQGFGQGIGQGIQSMLQERLQNLSANRQLEQGARFFKGIIPGISDDAARSLASVGEKNYGKILDRLEGLQIPGMEQAGAPQDQFQQYIQQQSMQQQPQQQEQPRVRDPQKLQEQIGLVNLMQRLNVPQERQQEIMSKMYPDVNNQPEPFGLNPLEQRMYSPTSTTQPSGVRLGPSSQERRFREQQELQRELADKKIAAAEKRAEKQDIRAAFKDTAPIRKEILEKARSAEQNLKDLDRMEELQDQGELDTPGYIEFLKRSGFDLPALMKPGSEEFQKLQQSFLRDAKTYFGARVSNFEIEQFLKTIPSLSQSNEGRKRVIAGLRRFNSAAIAYKDALKKVMKANNNVPPNDLLEKIDDKISKKLDRITAKFKEDLAKPVPPGQSRFITGLQSALGSAVGNIPTAVTSAGLGGAAGASIGGPPGAILGAGLGGLAGLLGGRLPSIGFR